MINQSRLHTCLSYSCLLSLTEKPSCRTVAAASSAHTAAPVQIVPFLRSSLADGRPYLRSVSPSSVMMCGNVCDCNTRFYDFNVDVDVDEHEDSSSSDHSMSDVPACTTQPLKHDTCQTSLPSRASCRVNFCPTVNVTLIPSHRDYSAVMKDQIWTSTERIRLNAFRNQMQLALEEDEEMKFEDSFIEYRV